MSLLYDAVRARKSDSLKVASQEDLTTGMHELWNDESSAKVPDLDVLFEGGILVAESAAPGVEAALTSWLTLNDSINAWDTAAMFLMGYWQVTTTIDRQLAASLLARLRRKPALPPHVQDTVVVALGRASSKTEDSKLREDIHAEFARFWEGADKSALQPLVKTVLMNALKIEE